MIAGQPASERPANWAGNVRFSAARFHRPSSLEQLQDLVASSAHAHALGSGHSFSRIADTRGDLIAVGGLPKTMDVDSRRSQVTVSAGLSYAELGTYLYQAGYALANLGSLPQGVAEAPDRRPWLPAAAMARRTAG